MKDTFLLKRPDTDLVYMFKQGRLAAAERHSEISPGIPTNVTSPDYRPL